MTNNVIYEEPKIGLFQWLRKIWEDAPVYPKGFTQEYINKMEAEKKWPTNIEENKKEKQEKPKEAKENGQRIPTRPEQAGGMQKEGVEPPRPDIPASGGSENKEERVKLNFYDFKTKQKFESDKYEIEYRNKRKFAVATTPSGGKTWRAMKKPMNFKSAASLVVLMILLVSIGSSRELTFTGSDDIDSESMVFDMRSSKKADVIYNITDADDNDIILFVEEGETKYFLTGEAT